MSTYDTDTAACGVKTLVVTERARLLRRCATDPRRSREAVLWAAERVLEDPRRMLATAGVGEREAVRATLARLADRRTALDTACARLMPAPGGPPSHRGDAVHQAYLELLGGLADNADWCCDDAGASVAFARTQLLFRARRRSIDAWRRQMRSVCLDDVVERADASTGNSPGGGLRDLYAYLRGNLAVAEHAKLDRFVLHAVLELPHDMIARESGMSHEALRAESSRFARRLRPLLEAYDRLSVVASTPVGRRAAAR